MKSQVKVFNVGPKSTSLECHTGGNRYPDAEIRAYNLDGRLLRGVNPAHRREALWRSGELLSKGFVVRIGVRNDG